MSKRKKRRGGRYSAAFKQEAIRLVESGQPASAVSRELGVGVKTLYRWLHQAQVDGGNGAPEELTSSEREELRALRREVEQLREEREILKKATAFFAKENE